MTQMTDIAKIVDPQKFLEAAIKVETVLEMDQLLAKLPIVADDVPTFDEDVRCTNWMEGSLHWLPVGKDLGNSGRIKLAGEPVNAIAERVVNGMEALIELERCRELKKDSKAPQPENPRAAVLRYFGLPPLCEIPTIRDKNKRERLVETARDLSQHVRVRLTTKKQQGKATFNVVIEDDGIGQSPDHIHSTLLSLGRTTKADKLYMIGVFGQGGSSAFSMCKYGWLISRRAEDQLDGAADGVGWTVVKQVFRNAPRRDYYYAYLAAHPDGRVPTFPLAVAKKLNIDHGSRFGHVQVDFKRSGSTITRDMYPAMNHLLYNPVMPYELYAAKQSADPMRGNAYRLARRIFMALEDEKKENVQALDKTYKGLVVRESV